MKIIQFINNQQHNLRSSYTHVIQIPTTKPRRQVCNAPHRNYSQLTHNPAPTPTPNQPAAAKPTTPEKTKPIIPSRREVCPLVVALCGASVESPPDLAEVWLASLSAVDEVLELVRVEEEDSDPKPKSFEDEDDDVSEPLAPPPTAGESVASLPLVPVAVKLSKSVVKVLAANVAEEKAALILLLLAAAKPELKALDAEFAALLGKELPPDPNAEPDEEPLLLSSLGHVVVELFGS